MARRGANLLLGGVVAVAGGTIAYVVTRRFLYEPPPFVCPPGEHVGTVGYVWPREDLFLDESGFGEALETFGYDVGNWDAAEWTACSEKVVGVVERFQRDFNAVAPSYGLALIRTDGLIDDGTVHALASVHDIQTSGSDWPLVVSEAKGQS